MIRAVIIVALIAAAWLAVAVIAAAAFGRAMRHAPAIGDGTPAVVCDPCNGRPGTWCRCASKEACPSPLCGAADTGVRGWSADELAYLNGETGELPK